GEAFAVGREGALSSRALNQDFPGYRILKPDRFVALADQSLAVGGESRGPAPCLRDRRLVQAPARRVPFPNGQGVADGQNGLAVGPKTHSAKRTGIRFAQALLFARFAIPKLNDPGRAVHRRE